MTPDQEEHIRSIVKGVTSYDQEERAIQRIFAEIRWMELKAYGMGYVAGTADTTEEGNDPQ